MRIAMLGTSIALLGFLAAGELVAQEAASAAALAAYTNQSGSTLYIESISSTGMVSGTYVNRAQGYSCQGTPYPVTGWLFQNVITFAVVWNNSAQTCNSVTGWTGYFSSDFQTLTTNWNLSVVGSTLITTGSDTFNRVAQARSESLIAPE